MKVELEEHEIKTGLQGNDQEQADAISKAYHRYAGPIASYIRERVVPTLDNHELTTAVNDVFIELAKKVREGNFKGGGSLKSLLFNMGRCNAIDQFRSKCRYQNRHASDHFSSGDRGDKNADGFSDDEIASKVAKKLQDAPEIAATWRSLVNTRTAADEVGTEEIVRQFRMWIGGGTLPALQRKVAKSMARHFGNITDADICSEIAETGERPTVASVKSARREIRDKFQSLIERQERTKQP